MDRIRSTTRNPCMEPMRFTGTNGVWMPGKHRKKLKMENMNKQELEARLRTLRKQYDPSKMTVQELENLKQALEDERDFPAQDGELE